MKSIIKVKNLGKRYSINRQAGSYIALRDIIAGIFKHPFRFLKKQVRSIVGGDKDTFWALKGIDFSVEKGEVVGIIGRNGAGKSTLLKILTGITPPTEGEAVMSGHTSSLLEVGTGFHPELTGRENIFLNGAILGMQRKDIVKNFDAIVKFADIEKFLDTPVKHYSSGMHVRLAFSVAAHLEPDILLVDEVLAVGDAEFQKKCLGKMEEVTQKEGRTILFVSHNMAAVERICDRVIWIEKGKIRKDSRDVADTIKEYLHSSEGTTEGYYWKKTGEMFNTDWYTPEEMYLVSEDGKICDSPVRNDETTKIVIKGRIDKYDPAITIGIALYSGDGTLIYWSICMDGKEEHWPKLKEGEFKLAVDLPKRMLNEGDYRIEMIGGLQDRRWLFHPGGVNPTINFSVRGGMSDSPYWTVKRPGILAPVLNWRLEE